LLHQARAEKARAPLDRGTASPYPVRVTNTSTPAFVTGLAELAPAYRVLLCDVWGVVHNGLHAHPAAADALIRYRAAGGAVLLITNAPRPKAGVMEVLDRFGVPRDAYDDVLTSGDAARSVLAARPGARVYHVGPDRDVPIYDGLPLTLAGEDDCDVISCTGLFDDEVETPDDYQQRLADWHARDLPMICVNPDIVVESGGRLIWCAGALAQRYRELGGETVLIGKPYAPVYDEAMRRVAAIVGQVVPRDQILAVGDGIATDIRGAVAQGIDVLFVTDGIHTTVFGERDTPNPDKVHEFLANANLGARAVIPRLVWGNGA
jgi:HAD superfamily hydrolase (TIGR01459 family)